MTDEEVRKANAQNREFPETMEIMGRIRAALAERVFLTPIGASSEREDLYTRVQAIDALMNEMGAILAVNASEAAVREYAEKFATTEPDPQA